MRLKICSDLHLEHSTTKIVNTGQDVLVLAGDIVPVDKIGQHRSFFDDVTSNFKDVIYVAGNHEFYRGGWDKTIDKLRDFANKYSNLHFLEDASVKICDVTFIGSTLWTDLNKRDPITIFGISNIMNDYKLIRNDKKGYVRLTPADTLHRHESSLRYINDAVKASDKVVIVTHHAPSFISVSQKHILSVVANGGYVSCLSEFIVNNPQIKLWIHGHLHNFSDYLIDGTRVVCNPRGYRENTYVEQTGFVPDFSVDV